MNRAQETVLLVHSLGYRVTTDGVLLNPLGRQIKVRPNRPGGYPFYTFRRSNFYPHRLQAFQKFGPRIFQSDTQVRHLNGNRMDFSESNIGIGTCSENRMDMPPATRKRTATIAANKRHAGKRYAHLVEN